MDTVYAIDINTTTFPAAKLASISSLMNFIIPGITLIASLGFGAMLMLGAFQWLTAGEKAENVGKAQKTMTFAAIGLFFIIFSYAFVKIIVSVLGVKDLPI